jgi:hypothetical protein
MAIIEYNALGGHEIASTNGNGTEHQLRSGDHLERRINTMICSFTIWL